MESAKAKNPVGGDDEEVSVGIECYANSASGFQAILKERYTDFIVNEIGLDGEVVHLTSLDAAVDEEIDSKEQEKRQKTTVQPSVTQDVPADPTAQERDARAPRDDVEKAPAAAAATPSETQGEGTDAKFEQAEETDFSTQIENAVTDFTKLAGAAEAERLKQFLEQPGVLSPAQEGKPGPSPLI
jgi:tRNA pseudouridine13 synthase